MFISWKNIMCTKNITLKRNSRICELHFKSNDIIKEDIFLQADGTIIHLKRKYPTLKKGAVPSIFPKKTMPCYQQMDQSIFSTLHTVSHSDEPMLSTSYTVSHSNNEPMPSTSHTVSNSDKSMPSTSHIVSNSDEPMPSMSHTVSHLDEPIPFTSNTVSYSDEPMPSTSHSVLHTDSEESICSTSFIKETTPQFSDKDINIEKNIEVPTSHWFTNINDSYMMWTCWANDLSYIIRRVIVKTDMKVQVFIGDKEISFDTKILNNIQEIKQILKKLENFFPCEKVNDNSVKPALTAKNFA